MANEEPGRPSKAESPAGEDGGIASGIARFAIGFLKEVLTGLSLLVVGLGLIVVGYVVGFWPLASLGALLFLFGLGSIYVW